MQVEAARVVARDGVEREGSEEEAARKPDYLSLPVSHARSSARVNAPRRIDR